MTKVHKIEVQTFKNKIDNINMDKYAQHKCNLLKPRS